MREGDEAGLRAAIVETARGLDDLGFCPSKSGNVSARWREGMMITPSGLPYAAMGPADIVAVGLDGEVAGREPGPRTPSSEWRLHAEIYRARAEAAAVVHTHSPKATALSCARRGLPAFHYMIAFCGGDDIRCAPYAVFGSQALAEGAVRALEDRKAALLANHGVVALGATLAGARAVAVEVENLADQYLALLAAGLEPCILDHHEMSLVAEKFSHYGRTA